MLAERYGKAHVLGGVCCISSAITAPGVVTQVSGPRTIVFGELDGSITPRAKAVYETFIDAGIDATLSDDVQNAIWTKYVFICALSGVGAVARATVGEMVSIPETRALLRETMEEVAAVARARAIGLDEDIVDEMMNTTEGFSAETKPSMLVDVENGNRLEIDALNSTVARLGADSGVPTPANRVLYAALKVADERAKRRAT